MRVKTVGKKQQLIDNVYILDSPATSIVINRRRKQASISNDSLKTSLQNDPRIALIRNCRINSKTEERQEDPMKPFLASKY
mmetsp:Transcript_14242/g.21727  ORF Transcript_14242/g.21727 Transcript_14242/m.21727 type:complete len:81 (-) Transcript_14242:521-763(-)